MSAVYRYALAATIGVMLSSAANALHRPPCLEGEYRLGIALHKDDPAHTLIIGHTICLSASDMAQELAVTYYEQDAIVSAEPGPHDYFVKIRRLSEPKAGYISFTLRVTPDTIAHPGWGQVNPEPGIERPYLALDGRIEAFAERASAQSTSTTSIEHVSEPFTLLMSPIYDESGVSPESGHPRPGVSVALGQDFLGEAGAHLEGRLLLFFAFTEQRGR